MPCPIAVTVEGEVLVLCAIVAMPTKEVLLARPGFSAAKPVKGEPWLSENCYLRVVGSKNRCLPEKDDGMEAMVDTPSPEELRKEFNKQVTELRKEIGRLTKSLADKGAETYEHGRDAAADALDQAKVKTRAASHQVQHQAEKLSDLAQENPGTVTTVVSSAGIAGFFLGVIVGAALASGSRR